MNQRRESHSNFHFTPIQNKKIFCAYHTNQFLTNFCKQSNHENYLAECLMPLCPSCISEHTQQHFTNSKKPIYQNLNEALNNTKQDCYLKIVTLENYRMQNQNIYQYISSLQENIHTQLEENKLQIFKLITKLFSEFEQKLISQVIGDYQAKNIYNIQQSINASSFIDQQINTLYQKISSLKGDDCLGSLITFHAYDHKNYEETLNQFSEYLDKNKKSGKIKICLNEQTLKQITVNICQKLLKVQSIVVEEEQSQICIQTQKKPPRFRFQENVQKQNKSMNASFQKQKMPKKIKLQVFSPVKKRPTKESQVIQTVNQTKRINQSVSSRKITYDSQANRQSKRLTRAYKQQ